MFPETSQISFWLPAFYLIDPEFKISTINIFRQGSVSIIKPETRSQKEPKGGNCNHGKKSNGRWDLHTDGFGRIACSGEGMVWGWGMSQL